MRQKIRVENTDFDAGCMFEGGSDEERGQEGEVLISTTASARTKYDVDAVEYV